MGTLLFIAGICLGGAIGFVFGFRAGIRSEIEEAARPWLPGEHEAADRARAFGEDR